MWCVHARAVTPSVSRVLFLSSFETQNRKTKPFFTSSVSVCVCVGTPLQVGSCDTTLVILPPCHAFAVHNVRLVVLFFFSFACAFFRPFFFHLFLCADCYSEVVSRPRNPCGTRMSAPPPTTRPLPLPQRRVLPTPDARSAPGSPSAPPRHSAAARALPPRPTAARAPGTPPPPRRVPTPSATPAATCAPAPATATAPATGDVSPPATVATAPQKSRSTGRLVGAAPSPPQPRFASLRPSQDAAHTAWKSSTPPSTQHTSPGLGPSQPLLAHHAPAPAPAPAPTDQTAALWEALTKSEPVCVSHSLTFMYTVSSCCGCPPPLPSTATAI